MLKQPFFFRYSETTASCLGSMVMTCEKWLPSTLSFGAGLCALVLAHAAQAAAILTPSSPSVIAGNTVTITLSDTIDSSSAVGAVDLQLTFNTALLSLQSVALGTLLSPPVSDYKTPYFNGTSTGAAISIQEDGNALSDPSGTGSVVTLTFLAFSTDSTSSPVVTVQTGSSAVGVFGEYQLLPVTDTINITAAPVTPPTSVPEPATMALLLGPMLAAASLRRRDRC